VLTSAGGVHPWQDQQEGTPMAGPAGGMYQVYTAGGGMYPGVYSRRREEGRHGSTAGERRDGTVVQQEGRW